jgi:hypothetical protein
MFRLSFFLSLLLCLIQPCSAYAPTYYTSTSNLVSSIEQKIVGFVYKTIDTLRYSSYKMGGSRFDPSHGVYIVDCSNYVDQILQAVSPHAYLSLVNSSGSYTPTTQHYYDFFSDLSDEPYWNKVNDVDQLRPGDIIVFRYKKSPHSVTRGHVMVVMDRPIRADNAFLVRVTDSAPVGHSHDTRPRHVSGIGVGTLLLKTNPKTGRPAAYAWRTGSLWKKNVNFAMARPMDLS